MLIETRFRTALQQMPNRQTHEILVYGCFRGAGGWALPVPEIIRVSRASIVMEELEAGFGRVELRKAA